MPRSILLDHSLPDSVQLLHLPVAVLDGSQMGQKGEVGKEDGASEVERKERACHVVCRSVRDEGHR